MNAILGEPSPAAAGSKSTASEARVTDAKAADAKTADAKTADAKTAGGPTATMGEAADADAVEDPSLLSLAGLGAPDMEALPTDLPASAPVAVAEQPVAAQDQPGAEPETIAPVDPAVLAALMAAARTKATAQATAAPVAPATTAPAAIPILAEVVAAIAGEAPVEGEVALPVGTAGAAPTDEPHAKHAAEGDAAAIVAVAAPPAPVVPPTPVAALSAPVLAAGPQTPPSADEDGAVDVVADAAARAKDAGPPVGPTAPLPVEPEAEVAAPANPPATGKAAGDAVVPVGADLAQEAGRKGGQGAASEDRREATARADAPQGAATVADGHAPAPHADFTAHLKAVQQGPQPPVHAMEQIAVKINRAVDEKQNQLSFQLRPGDLGRIDVTLDFADGRMRAAIVVENPQTLDLLQRDARALERALGDAGVKTESGSLSFSLREDPRQAFAGREGGRQGSGRGPSGLGSGEEEPASAAMAASYIRVGNGRVDVRV